MTQNQRRKAANVLKTFRKLQGWSPERTATELGWPVELYAKVESAEAGMSAGQQADVRYMLSAAAASAKIRDDIRARSRGIPRRRRML